MERNKIIIMDFRFLIRKFHKGKKMIKIIIIRPKIETITKTIRNKFIVIGAIIIVM